MKRLFKVLLASTLVTLNAVEIVKANKCRKYDERIPFDVDAYSKRYNH